ncbi:MAG: nuclear transport factor 2 family protein [Deltaproteobacteria bacterium]
MDKNQHPAMIAAHNSWKAVMNRDREAWFALMADEIRIEDPIGVAPTNPSGEGFCGLEEINQFWDTNIGLTESITIEAEQSYAAGSESAHILHLTTTFPGGAKMHIQGIFTYRVNDEGKLTNLRGYWSLDEARSE